MNEDLWREMTNELSIDASPDVFGELQAAYAEKHRFYHTTVHIESCLELFYDHRSMAQEPGELQCAIWFHDAVYNPMSGDNESKSAEWAVRFLKDSGCSDKRCDRVKKMIMATIHQAHAVDPDTQLLVDIDLAILGTDDDSYQRFEDDVRREYKWVPGPLFRRERRKILKSFLDRESIYSTEVFRRNFEAKARSNIERALLAL